MTDYVAPKPVLLCILDGWGYRAETQDNAIALGNTPNWDRLLATSPWSLIETSGLDVGLPNAQMGNSEVGHMNIGAGRVVMQDLPRIDQAVAEGRLANLPNLQTLIAAVKAKGGVVHLMGLMSPGGVHSHQDHMVALAEAVAHCGLRVKVHAFLDGRDTAPRAGKGFVGDFLHKISALSGVSMATVGGRYYAMDRDKRWDRVQKAYDAIVSALGPRCADVLSAIQASYDADASDEFVAPTIVEGYEGVADGDGLIMANFRSDRAREITQALLDPAFDGFERSKRAVFSCSVSMTEYSKAHNDWLIPLFPSEVLSGILGEAVSRHGKTQLRIAETEKYAHVTFFLNGGEEQVFPGEDRILIPSPKVATYDLKPEMSAYEVCDKLVEAIEERRYDLIVANFANGDMVGHTGKMDAALAAVEAVDRCLGRIDAALRSVGGVMILTADHGNVEMMKDQETGEPYTQHTVGKVYALLVNGPAKVASLRDGRLADLAPSVLALMGMEPPADMTGKLLFDASALAP